MRSKDESKEVWNYMAYFPQSKPYTASLWMRIWRNLRLTEVLCNTSMGHQHSQILMVTLPKMLALIVSGRLISIIIKVEDLFYLHGNQIIKLSHFCCLHHFSEQWRCHPLSLPAFGTVAASLLRLYWWFWNVSLRTSTGHAHTAEWGIHSRCAVASWHCLLLLG